MVEKTSSVAGSSGNLPYVSSNDDFQKHLAAARENIQSGQDVAPKQEPQKQPETSNWTRFWGGVKAVGGAIETTVGGAITVVGVATAEFGVGVPLMVAGGAITAHGVDVTISGVRTAWAGKEHDTFTSQGLQGLGMDREWSNLTDAGISIGASFGGSALLRGPSVAKALTELASRPNSISVALKPMLPVGHNMVGVNAGSRTQWTNLEVHGTEFIFGTNMVKGGTSIIKSSIPIKGYRVVQIPISEKAAQLAAESASRSVGNIGKYTYFKNDCSTYVAGIMRRAGLITSPITTPSVNYVTALLQSPKYISGLTQNRILPLAAITTNAVTAGKTGFWK